MFLADQWIDLYDDEVDYHLLKPNPGRHHCLWNDYFCWFYYQWNETDLHGIYKPYYRKALRKLSRTCFAFPILIIIYGLQHGNYVPRDHLLDFPGLFHQS